jgi:hypothetical protein
VPRYYTLAEARAALPEVVDLLRRLQAASGITAAPPAAPGTRATVNGHALTPRRDDAQTLLTQIAALGVQVKDIATGLIDFPHQRRSPATGQPEDVLLCYRLGEADILFWHDEHSGFAGRRPIDEL